RGGDSLVASPSFGVRFKGFTGWAWEEPANTAKRRAAAALANLQADSTFTTFLRRVRACLSSPAAPRCFVQFVQPEIYYPDMLRTTDRPHATAAEFVEFVWNQSVASG